jgi:hypothetical protein
METNESNTQRKFKWFWAWQDDKEEAWLAEMARQGWHLLKVNGPGFYTFLEGKPGNYAYRLDFQSDRKLDRHEYLGLFADSGWEYLGNMSGWHYFRKPVRPGGSAEIFTDNESKIAKYNRLMLYLLSMAPIYLVIFVSLPDPDSIFQVMLAALLWASLLLYGIVLIFLARRINKLKRL